MGLNEIGWYFFGISIIIGILLGSLSYILQLIRRSEERDIKKKRNQLINELEKTQKSYLSEYFSDQSIENSQFYNDLVFYPFEEDSPNTADRVLLINQPTSTEEIEEIVKEKQSTLQKRLDKIEARFPDNSTIDKLSSINDAVLATNLESIASQLNKLEDKVLTKWDVAIVVFEILGGIGVLIGIVFGLISFI